MAKIIPVKNCLDCPLSSVSDRSRRKIKEHGGFVHCESAKYPMPKIIGTDFYIAVKNFIPKWCPLQDEEDFLIQRI